ncbi:glycoside hydrolase 5 family protein [Chitinophaga flava]|uniref:1,4-beta-xylanase n=1 Tax=Chitinophaga flava TaxID=2259036 RepID=A0A365XRX7_9BACT|nr:cellulase family glycosylhydrolase [Chitinophaga flava]RBL89102.1 1,4-beta-xylanase [Chitinophaga flava]
MRYPILFIALMFILSGHVYGQAAWSAEKANAWYQQQGWLRGANFIPSSAVNQLEMWQEATFDPQTIDRELGYAQATGFNIMRVYLHHVAWQQDRAGFKKRLQQYLDLAQKHQIKTMFVFFDDCWRDSYQAGPQPQPIPGVHNSGWLKDPGGLIDRDSTLMDTLSIYVKDIIRTFKDDDRVAIWDLYNEPGHFKHGAKSWPLLKNVVAWARAEAPKQPITIGIWNKEFTDFNQYQLENSDIITFHNYRDSASMREAIDTLLTYNRPLICSEYMKRPNNSTFATHLPMMKAANVGAINWGLVAGKSQTNYPQGNKGGEPEPAIWYHDIFRTDGTPFDKEETDFIRKITSR